MTSPGQHGGYRRPANPAPVSGPGQLSRRTDGGPGQPVRVAPGGDYGDRQALVELEKSAPMAASPVSSPSGGISGAPSSDSRGGNGPPRPLVPLSAGTQRPGEAVTAGVDRGAGPGSDVLGLTAQTDGPTTGAMTQMLTQLGQGDTTGQLAQLLRQAQMRNA